MKPGRRPSSAILIALFVGLLAAVALLVDLVLTAMLP